MIHAPAFVLLVTLLALTLLAFDYGEDLSCVDDLEEEGRTVTGLELIAQAIVRRLSTPRGALLDDPDYGTDLTEYLHETIDRLVLARMRAEVRAELLKDERVTDVTIVALDTFTTPTGEQRIKLSLGVTLNEGALRLVLEVSQVTVQILELENGQ